MTALVDWQLAERTAATVISGLPGFPNGRRSDPPNGAGYTPEEVERACQEAIEASTAYAGLGAVESPPVAELIDRNAWARNTLATLAVAAAPLEQRISDDLHLPGPLGPTARRAVGAAVGAEAGIVAGYAGKRVLGQYDVAVLGPVRPARLLFVAENMAGAQRELEVDRDLFLRWVALHETTHVVQFERVDWLAAHIRGLASGLIDAAADGLDAAAVAQLGRRLVRDPRELVRALLRGELARLLSEPERRRTLDRLQATMSVIEGHAEHVMDAGADDLGPAVGELRRRLDQRRARRGGLGELIARSLGIGLKLRQYELGKEFCDAIVNAAGAQALQSLWRSAEHLPSLAELEAPSDWLGRVSAMPVRAY